MKPLFVHKNLYGVHAEDLPKTIPEIYSLKTYAKPCITSEKSPEKSLPTKSSPIFSRISASASDGL